MRKYYKYEMNLLVGNVLSIIFFIIACIPFVFVNLVFDFEMKSFLILMVLYLIWMLFHELLHGLGHMICGVNPKDISMGASLEKGVAFCLIRKEVNKRGILISLLFPFVFIGVVTYIIGIMINNPYLMLLSALNISGASIDLLMAVTFARLGSDITYIEPEDGTSFYLMSDKPIKKLFGFKLIKEGTYDKDMFKGNYKRIDISKFSIIVLILFAILTLLAFII